MQHRNIILFLVCVLLACNTPSTQYDILITNAIIYDGSGEKPIIGSIAIDADKIVDLGNLENVSGKKEIDAKGMAVSPGFINMLSWATESLIEDGRGMSDIKQGVTLEVMGEGWSMGPINETMKTNNLKSQGDIKYDIPWTTLGEYLEFLERKGVAPNVASFMGATTTKIHE